MSGRGAKLSRGGDGDAGIMCRLKELISRCDEQSAVAVRGPNGWAKRVVPRRVKNTGEVERSRFCGSRPQNTIRSRFD